MKNTIIILQDVWMRADLRDTHTHRQKKKEHSETVVDKLSQDENRGLKPSVNL